MKQEGESQLAKQRPVEEPMVQIEKHKKQRLFQIQRGKKNLKDLLL